MKALLTALLLTASTLVLAQNCSPGGNIAIFANYDGGVLNINCDANIPNLKIGVVTYEWTQINISGPFAANVTEVVYAGFNAQNGHCGLGNQPTSVTGVSPAIVNILFAPPATIEDPNGNNSIICGYTCDSNNQGGCNTAQQIVAYFTSTLGGSLYSYTTQYGCWSGSYTLSDGICCGQPSPVTPVTVNISASDPIVCVGQCINFTSTTTGSPTNFAWTFTGAQTPSSTSVSPTQICYLNEGVFPATLTASNASASASATVDITVIACGIPGCTYPDATNYNPAATVDNLSCQFECDPVPSSCPSDLNYDGMVNATDLSVFLSDFATFCQE
ncbi:MAG: PKD domain-containing protein [Flavobacteriales bacterium]